MNQNEAMTRYTAGPTKYDSAAYGSICKVMKNDDGSEYELYVQTSPDQDNPLWLSAGEVLVTLFKDKLKDESFIKELLQAKSYDIRPDDKSSS